MKKILMVGTLALVCFTLMGAKGCDRDRTVLIVGHSMPTEDNSNGYQGWPHFFRDICGSECDTFNYSAWGSSLPSAKAQITQAIADGVKPDTIVIDSGHNDCMWHDWSDPADPSDVQERFQDLLNTAKATGADIFFVENSPWAGYTNYNPGCSQSANDWMESKIDGNYVLDTVVTDWLGDSNFYLLSSNEMWAGEGLHYDAAAAEEVAQEVYDTLRPYYP